jgi:hypothetical protein
VTLSWLTGSRSIDRLTHDPSSFLAVVVGRDSRTSLHLPRCGVGHCRLRCHDRVRRSACVVGGRVLIPLLLDALSAYRLTRLITADSILDGPRDALVRWSWGNPGLVVGRYPVDKADEEGIDLSEPGGWSALAQVAPHAPKLAKLITCRWCSGWYCAVLVVVARRRFPRQWAPIAEALALSAGAALIAGLED